MTKPSLSIIIPAYNEERTVAAVVQVALNWGRAKEVIVIDDGSTDNTANVLKHFGDQISLTTLPKNYGKGYAASIGIKQSTGELIMLLDADLLGLTHHALDLFLKPMLSRKYSMVIGTPRTHGLGEQKIYHQLSGERIFWRQNLLPLLDRLAGLGYGLEVFFNAQFSPTATYYTPLPYVYLTKRYEKYGFYQSTVGYLKEIIEVSRQLFTQAFRIRR